MYKNPASLGGSDVRKNHLFHQAVEGVLGLPAKNPFRLCRRTKQGLVLQGPIVLGVHSNADLGSDRVDANFIEARTRPSDRISKNGVMDKSNLLDFDSDDPECGFHKLPHAVCLTRGKNIVAAFGLLENEMCPSHVVLRMTPISDGVEIAQLEVLGQPTGNQCNLGRNFTGNKCGA